MPSTVISSTTYNPQKKILRVIFLSGAVYDYLDVPQKVYDNMLKAFSKGTFLNGHIKQKYVFKKIR